VEKGWGKVFQLVKENVTGVFEINNTFK